MSTALYRELLNECAVVRPGGDAALRVEDGVTAAGLALGPREDASGDMV